MKIHEDLKEKYVINVNEWTDGRDTFSNTSSFRKY